MNKTLLILTMGILGFLFGCSSKSSKGSGEKFPAENFSVLQAEMDGKPAFIMLNSALKDYSFKKEFPWCLEINVELKEKNEQGLTTNKEAEILNNLEDQILSSISKNAKVHFAVRTTWNGWRDITFYVDNPEAVNEQLQELTSKENPTREFGFQMTKDENWDKVSQYYK